MITIIAAIGNMNELGRDNKMLWHLPDDFKRFKRLTTDHHIIMGRKTLDSLPGILPNRIHVVITRNENYTHDNENVIIVHSMEEALEVSKNDNQPFIIGGGEIYKLGLEVADKIELTMVHGLFDHDTLFPVLQEGKWELVASVPYPKDDRHKYDFTYLTYLKN
jgi:dihydrofolate reductase